MLYEFIFTQISPSLPPILAFIQATGKKEYLDKAIATFYQCCYVPGGYQVSVLDWADMTMGINLLLYEVGREETS